MCLSMPHPAATRLHHARSGSDRLAGRPSANSGTHRLGVSVRLLSPGTRDCVEPAQRKAGQLADRPRRRRAARISASATLSSSSSGGLSWVVSVLAWPRRRRTASMDTPHFQLGGVGVAQLVDADVDPGRAAVALPPAVGGVVGQRPARPVDAGAEQRPGGVPGPGQVQPQQRDVAAVVQRHRPHGAALPWMRTCSSSRRRSRSSTYRPQTSEARAPQT